MQPGVILHQHFNLIAQESVCPSYASEHCDEKQIRPAGHREQVPSKVQVA